MPSVADASSDAAREAAVLDRITAFRRRRPRLTDDVVTLAHGAGGKASAALVDAVFLDQFVGADHGPLQDAAVLLFQTAIASPSAPTRSSSRRGGSRAARSVTLR